MKPHDHTGEEACFTAIIDGLTKREIFALQIYCALIIGVNRSYEVEDAVLLADRLLERLAK